jgi:hypothetical protein
MKYILLDYVTEAGYTELTKEQKVYWLGAYKSFIDAMTEAGILKNNVGLQPTSTATTVRTTKEGKTTVLDGPYSDSKEQLGGFRIIDVPDLDAALQWAARCPTALHGVVEVRPLMDISMDDLLESVKQE